MPLDPCRLACRIRSTANTDSQEIDDGQGTIPGQRHVAFGIQPFRDAATRFAQSLGRLGSEAAMPIWLVRTTWNEDETEATEQWQVNADTAADALKEVTQHVRLPPHHVEGRLCLPDDTGRSIELQPGEVRRVVPT